MKKPKSVLAAEALVDAKDAEIVAAQAALKQLEMERREAYLAVRAAQAEADAALPQCRMVRVRWRSGGEEELWRVVIVRKTPGGMLVVRRVGEPDGYEERFRWAAYAGNYRQQKPSSFASDHYELRDVPADFMPVGQEA